MFVRLIEKLSWQKINFIGQGQSYSGLGGGTCPKISKLAYLNDLHDGLHGFVVDHGRILLPVDDIVDLLQNRLAKFSELRSVLLKNFKSEVRTF